MNISLELLLFVATAELIFFLRTRSKCVYVQLAIFRMRTTGKMLPCLIANKFFQYLLPSNPTEEPEADEKQAINIIHRIWLLVLLIFWFQVKRREGERWRRKISNWHSSDKME